MENIQVVKLEKKDMNQAAKVLGLAFADTPMVSAMTGGNKEKAQKLLGSDIFAVIKLGRQYSKVSVALLDGNIVGVLKEPRVLSQVIS